MSTYVALLQGINIGSKKRIAMADLRSLVEELGHQHMRTYFNSGNVVFESDFTAVSNIETAMATAISDYVGSPVPVVVRTASELTATVANNPFSEHVLAPKMLHVTFLDKVPDPELVDALALVERGDDDYRVIGKDVYLYYPNLVTGAVFMSAGLDKALSATATSRNWRTVTTLLTMCECE